jgi:diguanylate cyclase (GGDEF)-like protein
MLKIILFLLFFLLCLAIILRILIKNRKLIKELKAQSSLQSALLEVDRLLGDSLTQDLSSTMQQMMEILARYLNPSLVWIGTYKAEDDSVSIQSLAGPRREVAVRAKIYIGTGGFDGSVHNALESIVAQYMPLLGDNSYRGWPIADDVIFHASLSVPYRSLNGDKGIIAFFLPKAFDLVSPNHTLWMRLADDFAVFLERHKKALDINRISGYQLAIADLLNDILKVKELQAAYDLVLLLLTSRADAFGAWIVACPEQKDDVSSYVLIASKGCMPEISLRYWLEKPGAVRQWLHEVIERMRYRGCAFIDEVKYDARLETWRDSEPTMDKTSVIGAWPLWGDTGLQAILFISSNDPAYFSNNLQVFLYQLTEILHIANQQIHIKADIRRRNLLYQALLDEADVVLKMKTERPLLEEVCRGLVGSKLFDAAWLARPGDDGSLSILAYVSSVPLDRNGSVGRIITADLERSLVGCVWETGKALFPSLTPRKEASSNTDTPVALLPVLRSAKLWSVLVVRSQMTEYLSEDVAGLLQRVASLLGRGLDEMDLKQKLADEQIRQSWLASHDPLTGLTNRRGLETYFFHAILRVQRNRTSLAVLLIDLDDFKPVNDTYGHEAGDQLLVRVAGALQDAIRNTDFLVRLGGDEFVILLEGLHKADDLLPVMDNIYKAVVTPFMLEAEIKVSVGCSAGLTLYPEDSATPDGLLRHADEALYVAKRNKQSRPQYWVNYLDILAAEKND